MSEELEVKRCPRCQAVNRRDELPERNYRCSDCGLELAHFTTLSTGAIRDVIGWLLEIGTIVRERYRVTGVLGKGGFGVTYLVDDILLHGKRRAMKEIPAVLFDEYETRLLGRLSHPAIPDITDRFTADAMVYLVLEFGGNRTLRSEQQQRGGRIPLFVLLPWIRQLCAALQYLHEQDPPIVHRDLKPDNVLLDDHGRVMLIDFGIAKEAATDSATRTIGRAVSHGFSPPEQVLGTGTDARSDVYALGAITYNLLTNQMPPAAHERVTGQALEPLASYLPEIPPLIESAVMQALELNINLRQQSIAEFVRVLDLVQSGSDSAQTVSVGAQTQGSEVVLPSVQLPSTRSGRAASQPASVRIGTHGPSPVRPRRPWFALAASLALIALGGGAGWWLWQAQDGAPARPQPPGGQDRGLASPDARDEGTKAVSQPHQATNDMSKPRIEGSVSDTKAPAGTKETLDREPASGPLEASPPGAAGGLAETPTSAGLPLGGHDGAQDAELPSIFSDDPPPVANLAPNGSEESLMDLFEKHRRETRLAAPAAAPEPDPEPKPQREPQPARAAEAAVVEAAQPAEPPPKPKPRGTSNWGFQYKGATKKY